MRCLSSIPVREDVQVIVVDDNSDDSDSYLEKYHELSRPYLSFLRTTKGEGAGFARNVGLDHAEGKWLIFADADDYFTESFERILDEYKNVSEEMVYFRSKWVMSDDVTKPSPIGNWIDPMIDRYFQTGNEQELRCNIPNPWGKFYRRDYIKTHHFRFHETQYANDTYFVISASVNCPRIKVADEVIYSYTFRTGSLSTGALKGDGELEIRIKEGLSTQQVILASRYRPKNLQGMGFLSVAFHSDKKLFRKYFYQVVKTGLSPLQAMAELRYRERGILNKMWVYVYCILCIVFRTTPR